MNNKLCLSLILLVLSIGAVKLYLATTAAPTKVAGIEPNHSARLVTIYSRVGCGYCDMAKDLLTKSGINFESVELSNNPDLITKLFNQTGQKTVPYIYVDDRFIGGYQNLRELIESGGL